MDIFGKLEVGLEHQDMNFNSNCGQIEESEI